MSLVGTLAKVAMGAMVAKGVSGAMKGGAGGGLGGLLGGVLGQGGAGGAGGGLGGLLGGLAGQGQQGQQGQQQGRQQQQGQQGGGGLADLLGSALSGQAGGQQGGGLGGLLESLGGGGQQQQGQAPQQGQSGGFGDLFNSALAGNEQPPEPTAEQQAEVCLRAMLNAAKSDGQIDAAEQEKITGQLGDISQHEADFIRQEMAAPMDFDAFVQSVPKGMEQQVYLMSLLAIDLDTQAEAQYLDKLAKAINIDQQTSNAIHQKLGVPALYS